MTLSNTLYAAPTQALSLAKKVTSDYQEHGARLTLWNYYSVLLRETRFQVDKFVEDPAEDPCAAAQAAAPETDEPSLTGLAKHVTGRVSRQVQARVMNLKDPIVKRTSELLHIDLIQYSELILDQKAKVLDPRVEQLQAKLADLQGKVNKTKESVRSTVQKRRAQVAQGVSQHVTEAKVRLHVLKRSSEAMSNLSLKYIRTTTVASVPSDTRALAAHYYSTLGSVLLKQNEEQLKPEEDEYAELDAHLLNLAESLWGVLMFWRSSENKREQEEQDGAAGEKVADVKVADEKVAEEVPTKAEVVDVSKQDDSVPAAAAEEVDADQFLHETEDTTTL